MINIDFQNFSEKSCDAKEAGRRKYRREEEGERTLDVLLLCVTAVVGCDWARAVTLTC